MVEGFAIRHKDGSSTAVAFAPAPPDTAGLTATQAWDALSSVAFSLPADAESLVVKYSFMSDKALSLKQGPAAVEMQFKASTVGANAKVSNFPKLALVSNQKVTLAKRRLSMAAKAFTPGATMVFKTRLRNQRRNGLSVSLGHIYDFSGTSDQKIVAKSRAGASGAASSAPLVGARNYPNPFNPETTITYQLPQAALVSISIYNLKGERIRALVKAAQTAGRHDIRWDGRNDRGAAVASGVYLARIEAGRKVEVRKMTLVR